MPVIHGQVQGAALNHVYGPVKSRRHGLSLGINVGLEAEKICTWSCLYCQCGFGRRDQLRNLEVKRAEVPEIMEMIKDAVTKHPDLDVMTFAGNTEPGTYPEILPLMKALIRYKVMSRARWKIIVLSNGSELWRDDVLQAFDMADEAWLKLDVGTQELFQKLNRPMKEVGTLEEHIARLKKLKKLRLQTMLWNAEKPDQHNSAPEHLQALLQRYQEIKPIDIQVTTIARDTAMPGLLPLTPEQVRDFQERANQYLRV